MTKTELMNAVAEKAGFSKKDADKAVSAVLEAITDALTSGEKVQLVGFGTFEVKDKPARMGINPSTGEKIEIDARKAVSFKPAKNLKELIK